MNAPDDLVLLIHGTYAGSEDDSGHRWWQHGSATWEALKSKLPHATRLPKTGEFFHWCGENHERARIKASHELFGRLRQLESSGQGYHLIGHSHGGSVIWGALRLATLRKEPLDRLKSWSTVGTPFMHHRTPGALSVANLVKLGLALTFLNPVFRVLRGLVLWTGAALFGWHANMVIPGDSQSGVVAIFRAPFLALMNLLGVASPTTEGGIRIGTYDPGSGQSFFDYLFLSGEGWIILSICLLYLFVFAQLASFLLSPILESLHIHSERRLEKNVADHFGGRWLGLWSPDDEAINGLRATLDLSVSFVSRIAPRERVFFSDNASLLSRPYFWVLAPLFNNLMRPVLDRIVRSHVIKTAQGNNRPAAEVIEVLPAPKLLSDPVLPPSISESLNRKLVQEADRCASGIAPKLRNLLAQPSFTASLAAFGKNISGRELVHTSYFDHDEILELLLMNMAWSNGDASFFCVPRSPQHDLLGWFQQFKAVVGVTLDTSLLKPSLAGPHGRPQDRAPVVPLPGFVASDGVDTTVSGQ